MRGTYIYDHLPVDFGLTKKINQGDTGIENIYLPPINIFKVTNSFKYEIIFKSRMKFDWFSRSKSSANFLWQKIKLVTF